MNKRAMERELRVLQCLRVNGRMPLTLMARKTGIPVSTLHDYVTKTQLVKKFTVLLDYQKLGYNTRFFACVSVHRDNREKTQQFLLAHPHVNSVYKINNGFDFLFEGVFETLREVEEFLEECDKLYKIKSKEIHYIIDEYKREAFMADGPVNVERMVRW